MLLWPNLADVGLSWPMLACYGHSRPMSACSWPKLACRRGRQDMESAALFVRPFRLPCLRKGLIRTDRRSTESEK
ncbi:MAG: hypothetical protein OQJ97_17400 [Rhodospirillales bacterium]|nr:hypothetical protein [Rhodospirillales bacterium]